MTASFITLRWVPVIRCLLSVSVLSTHASLPHTKADRHIPSSLLLTFSLAGFFDQLRELPVSSPCSFWLFSAVLCVSDLSPLSGMSRLGVCLLFPQKFSILKLVAIFVFIIMLFVFFISECSACVKQTVNHSLVFSPSVFCTVTFSFSLSLLFDISLIFLVQIVICMCIVCLSINDFKYWKVRTGTCDFIVAVKQAGFQCVVF